MWIPYLARFQGSKFSIHIWWEGPLLIILAPEQDLEPSSNNDWNFQPPTSNDANDNDETTASGEL